MDLKNEILEIGKRARKASRELVRLDTAAKCACLVAMADELAAHREEISQANKLDLDAGREAGIPAPLLDRLTLSEKRIDALIEGLRHVAGLPDPVGELLREWVTPAGLRLRKVRVPLGVVAIIYESRPNVTADASSLCIMSSNAVILRGGKEAIHTNRCIADILQRGGRNAGLPDNCIQLLATTDREAIAHLVQLEDYVDLVIPRGGEALIRAVTNLARVPVIKHYKGVCHLYIHPSADLEMAELLVENSKCQRPGVCNALEKLLVDKQVAAQFLPRVVRRLRLRGVEVRGDSDAKSIVADLKLATEQDWTEEYLDLVLAVRVVSGVEEAIAHINNYGSHHSDGIVASDRLAQDLFTSEVDSACVYINTSTRFTDGARFGMGAEMGISTDKIHARGPMALEELTTYKYIGVSEGLIVGE